MTGVQWQLRPWFTTPTLADLEQYAVLILAAISRLETLNKRNLFHRSRFSNAWSRCNLTDEDEQEVWVLGSGPTFSRWQEPRRLPRRQ